MLSTSLRVRTHTTVVGEEWKVELRAASDVREDPQGRPRGQGRSRPERVENEAVAIFPAQDDRAWEPW